MASVTALRDGIAANLQNVLGLRTFPFVSDQITTPAAVVFPDPGTFLTFGTSYGGQSDDFVFVVVVAVSRSWDRTGQAILDSFLDATSAQSVKAAIECDPTLGGVADDLKVTEARNYGQLVYSGIEYYGVEFAVQVLVSNPL
jgi:hypothetical protein